MIEELEAIAEHAPETTSSCSKRSPSPPVAEHREREIRCTHVKRSHGTEGITQASFHLVSSAVAPYAFQNALPSTPADLMLHPLLLETETKSSTKQLTVVWQRSEQFKITADAIQQDYATFKVSMQQLPSRDLPTMLSELGLGEEDESMALAITPTSFNIVVNFSKTHIPLSQIQKVDTEHFVGLKGVLA